MLFNSHIFMFIFLPTVWLLYTVAFNRRWSRGAIGILVLASFIFYGYWSLPYLGLLLFSIGFNFVFSHRVILRLKKSKWPLIVGIAVNLGLLFYFKYANFFIGSVGELVGQSWNIAGLILPLGISFFTFQQIAYLVDCHRGIAIEHRLLHYSLFVSFFPQLIAGPIVHHKEMIPQFSKSVEQGFQIDNISIGTMVFTIGLFKKVVLADSLSPFAIDLFDGTGVPDLSSAWLGTLCYTLQIYFDFSGYSDMAIGLGRLFNIKIPTNFNSPYRALSIVSFWGRWHITLSRFLKDYLYIPLGGNRKGHPRRYVNLMITMVLGGLWHGANWTFVLWGLVHGLFLCVNRAWETVSERAIPKVFSWTMTFGAVAFAWVLFRSPSVTRSMQIYKGLLGLNPSAQWNPFDEKYAENMLPFALDDRVILVFLGMILVLVLPPVCRFINNPKIVFSKWMPAACGILFLISVIFMTRVSEFLYFQF